MCLAIPGKIIKIINANSPIKYAVTDFEGVTKEICIAWVDEKEGDYILTHAGLAISVGNEEEDKLNLDARKRTENDK